VTAFHKAHPRAGARPGTLVIPPGAPAPRMFLMVYSAGSLDAREISGLDALPPDQPPGTVVWLDVRGFGDEALIRAIGARFGMTALAIEDAVNAPQRPKSERYAEHQLIVSRVPTEDDEGDIALPQVCLIVGARYLVSFQERFLGLFDEVRERLRDPANQQMRASGPDYLAYALVDAMVDRYYPVAEALANELDEIEDTLLEAAEDSSLARLREVRRQVVMARRIASPQREMVTSLQRETSPFIGDQVREYLRDTGDHISQISELLDASRDVAAALSSELLSMIAQRTNETMKVLTLMASLFIPLTFIAGVYGMNFDNIPELHMPGAYPTVLGLMAVVAAGMIYYFYRRGWLGR
jgi:magnesium transporter